MNIVTEPKLSGKPIGDKPHKRPVRLVRWFIIVGTAAGAAGRRPRLVQLFPRQDDRAVLREQQAAADQRQHRHGEVRNDSESPDRGRRSRRRASGQRHLRRQRPHHRDPVHCRRQRESRYAAACNCSTVPSRATSPTSRRSSGWRRSRWIAPSNWPSASSDRRRPWIRRRPRSIRPTPASPRPKPSSRRSWCGRRSTANSAFARSRSDSI